MGKNQILALKYLHTNGRISGIVLHKELRKHMSYNHSYNLLNDLISLGYVMTLKPNRYSDNSIGNKYVITAIGRKALITALLRVRPVIVGKGFTYKGRNVDCTSYACLHAQEEVCTCSCGGSHHGKAVSKKVSHKVNRKVALRNRQMVGNRKAA